MVVFNELTNFCNCDFRTPKDNVNFLRATAFICSKLIIETLIETIEIIDNIICCVKSTQRAQ